MDERFKKCPWLFRKGNKTGKAAQRRSAARLRMENLIQRLTNNGDVIVQFFCAVASGQPFMILVVKDLPMTKEQEAVAQGIATPAQKAAAKKQRRFIVTRRPYYPPWRKSRRPSSGWRTEALVRRPRRCRSRAR